MITAAGMMSGTSLDGIDVAVVDIHTQDGQPRFELSAFAAFPYAAELRTLLNALLPPHPGTAEQLAVAHRRIGEAYAGALAQTLEGKRVDFVAMHGQTVYHDGERAVTLQLGSPYFLRDGARATVCFDFRSADCALDGHGAPLVPYVDALLLASPHEDRVAVNLGGIANLTYLPKGGTPADAVAFDSGPANMLVDAFVCARTAGAMTFDRDGALALAGAVHGATLEALASDAYFAQPAPKSTGRERFGDQFLAQHARLLDSLTTQDGAATLTALTAQTLARAVKDQAPPQSHVFLSGGGARNPAMIAAISERLAGYRVETTDAMQIPVDAKEAIAFALLGFETLRGRPANLPRVTGARSATVLGAIVPYHLEALLAKVGRA